MHRIKTNSDFHELEAALSDTAPETDDWRTYNCSLVTPLYGGGVNAGEVDTDHPIRVSGIRGQLRFWWRIACGPFECPKQMFERESKIWGGIGGDKPLASRVTIKIEACGNASTIKVSDYQPNWIPPKRLKGKPNPHNYAFVDNNPGDIIKPELSFKLKIRFNDSLKPSLNDAQKDEAIRALRWWASFGGVGSRTRRGLGALHIEGLAPVSKDEVEQNGGLLTFTEKNRTESIECWETAINRLVEFRQGVNIGRNEKREDSRSPAGQSRWPEADSIRNLSKCSLPKHEPDNKGTNLFPRAAFGLPIVFHFKDAPKKNERADRAKDPIDHTLKPKKFDRMASPLILRPYWNGKHWQAAALLLPNWEEALGLDLQLESNGNTYNNVNGWPTDQATARETAKQIPPMKNQQGEPLGENPLTAFMAFFEGNQP